MHIDPRHKGLAAFRAVRAERKEVAILAKEVAESNPNKTPEECKALALEIRKARERTARADHKRQQKNRSKGKRNRKRTVEVTVVNPVAK